MNHFLTRTNTPAEKARRPQPGWAPRSALCTCFALVALGCGDSTEPEPEPGAAGTSGPSAAGTSGPSAAGTSGPSAAGTSGIATAGRSGTPTAGRSGTPTAGASGTPTAGRSGTPTAGTSGTPTAGTSGMPVTDPNGYKWETLITGDWAMAPGTEGYVCVRQTVTEELYVSVMEAVNPPGTHHTFLSMGAPAGVDGTTKCDFTVNQRESIFGSGVGTSPVVFPKGVAFKIPANTQILLNLHLFNADDTKELLGTSGTRYVRIQPGEFEYLGMMRNVRQLNLSIPPMKETTIPGTAMMEADTTIFAILPHLHQLGSHVKVTAVSSIEGMKVLHDAAYDFETQLYTPVESVKMAKGDKLQFECTWMNTTTRTITFGDSSTDEMCAIGVYRYPGVVPPGSK